MLRSDVYFLFPVEEKRIQKKNMTRKKIQPENLNFTGLKYTQGKLLQELRAYFQLY